ncbi:MAG: aminoacyl-tRNA hydrolase [bacterium]
MILIAGLGNPGTKYKNTRHSVGFRAIDQLGFLNSKKVLLLKPKTFMNNSGKAVKSFGSKYKIPASNIWVVHDDIDLALGKIKIAQNRGSAGHKGVESIIKELKTKNFVRFRIGIKPKRYALNAKNLDKFVLQKFTKEEEKIIKEAVQKTAEAIKTALEKGLEKAMNQFNK